jgi:tRNA-dependent cyclodipeptide synthase
MDNPLFEGDSLKALLFWTAEKFERTLVIVGDYLNRFNERILFGCDEKRAGELAVERGDLFISHTKELFSGLAPGKIVLTRWKEHLLSEQFGRVKLLLDEIFKTNEQFRSSVEYDASSFVERQRKHNKSIAVDMEEAMRLSCEYIIEEIAVFNLLSEAGWDVELYPGAELRVLAEVAKGRYPRVPDGLKQRINVELKINRRC